MTGSVLSLRERHVVNPSNRLSSGNTKADGEGRQFNQTIVIRGLRVTTKGRTHCGNIQRDTQTSCFIYTHSWLTISLLARLSQSSAWCKDCPLQTTSRSSLCSSPVFAHFNCFHAFLESSILNVKAIKAVPVECF